MKRIIGWSMMLLGLVALAGAVADSKIGSWLRAPGPTAVSAPVTDIDRISVRADTGLIRITAVDRPDLTVTLNGENPDTVKVDIVRHGSELQLRIRAPWWHSPRFGEPATVEIGLPRTLALTSLDVAVQTAKVEIRHISAGRLTYDGVKGALSAESVQTRETNIRLITGKIELAHHVGAIQAQLTTGMMEARLDSLSGPVTINVATGQVDLDLPEGAGFALNARVRSGVVTSELPHEGMTASGQRTVQGTHGAGTHAVDLRAGTGKITVR